MSTTSITRPDATTRLRTILRANVAVTSVSAVGLVAAAGTFADILDIPTLAVRLIGAGILAPFALGVAWSSRADAERLPTLARVIGYADVLWVVATVVVVALDTFSTTGAEFALVVAAMVGGFAVAEIRGAAAAELDV